MTMRRCAWSNCPRLIPTGQRYCKLHARAREHQRGTRAQRGYGKRHQRERARWAYLMGQGVRPICKRCNEPVNPSQPWDLGHSDDRQHWTGPEHSHCNRKAGAINSNRMREHWQ